MSKALRIVLVLVAILSLGFIVPLSQAQDTGKTIIRVRGPTLWPLWWTNWPKPMLKTIVTARCGQWWRHARGLKALVDKTASVAMAARETNAQEKQMAFQKGVKLVEKLIGWDALAIIAHPANPVKELSVDQVRKTFTGDYTDWNDLGGEILPIVLYVGDATKSSMAQLFNESILKTTPPYVNPRRYYPSVIIKDVSSRAMQQVTVPLALALEAQGHGTIKILGIKKDADSRAILPTHETVADHSYPLLRPLFLCYDANSTGKAYQAIRGFLRGKCMSIR